jgi:hypothetical protein
VKLLRLKTKKTNQESKIIVHWIPVNKIDRIESVEGSEDANLIVNGMEYQGNSLELVAELEKVDGGSRLV